MGGDQRLARVDNRELGPGRDDTERDGDRVLRSLDSAVPADRADVQITHVGRGFLPGPRGFPCLN